jgi:DNA-binding transcriptional regulator YdaS (Cro superfamily)
MMQKSFAVLAVSPSSLYQNKPKAASLSAQRAAALFVKRAL